MTDKAYTCDFCLNSMAARSPKQLALRKMRLREYPHIRPAPCPCCNGTDWISTDARVVAPPPRISEDMQAYIWIGLIALIAVAVGIFIQ